MYDISPEELKDYKAYTIVDIRDSMSYAYGHLPDAISVPQAELSTYIDEWKDAGKILIYCKRRGKSGCGADVTGTGCGSL